MWGSVYHQIAMQWVWVGAALVVRLLAQQSG